MSKGHLLVDIPEPLFQVFLFALPLCFVMMFLLYLVSHPDGRLVKYCAVIAIHMFKQFTFDFFSLCAFPFLGILTADHTRGSNNVSSTVL